MIWQSLRFPPQRCLGLRRTSIYDREQVVKAEYGDVGVFGRDGDTIEKILNRLVEHVRCRKAIL